MKYKALFLDLDGTTVHSEIHDSALPSARVTAAISRIKSDLFVCIATGRPLYQCESIFEHLKPSGLCILNNGVQIYDPKIKQIVAETPINTSLVPKITAIAKKHNVSHVDIFDGFKDSVYMHNSLPEKILSVYIPKLSEKKADAIIDDLHQFSELATHKMTHRKKFYIEVSNSEASKLHGIVEVCKRLSLDRAEIIGVGDSYNDFPLLMACGLKFAMGNATQELKEIADFVAPRVDQDGVAVIIEKFILPLFE